MQSTGAKQNIHISARVFRAAKNKPWYIPRSLWNTAIERRWFIAGKWEDHGVIAKTEDGSVSING